MCVSFPILKVKTHDASSILSEMLLESSISLSDVIRDKTSPGEYTYSA